MAASTYLMIGWVHCYCTFYDPFTLIDFVMWTYSKSNLNSENSCVLFQPLTQLRSPYMKLINKSGQPNEPSHLQTNVFHIIKDINAIVKEMLYSMF